MAWVLFGGKRLFTRDQPEGLTSHIGILGHQQSVLESTSTSVCEDGDWVYASYVDHAGEERQIKSQFLAAADGKTGLTRKHYLESEGIHLEWAER